MGKIIETKINRFDGGITNIIRNKDLRYARIVKNFDIFTDPNRLIPFRDMGNETIDATAAVAKFCKYLVATNAAQTASLHYALGVVSGQTFAKLFSRTLPNGTWEEVHSANAQDSVARNEDVFIEYKNIIYGWSRVDGSNARLWSYAITTGTFTSTAKSLTAATSVVQGLVHSKDDILYIPYNTASATYIAKYNGSSWTDMALTLPSNSKITSICEYGNYLAIATKPRHAGGKSIVYLWDRDASLTTLSEKIDWGSEELELIEEINGYLVGISVLSNYTGYAFAGTIYRPKIIFKYWAGGLTGTKEILHIPLGDTSSNVIIAGKQKVNNRLYFLMSAEVNNVQYDAVWNLGISAGGNWALTIDRALNNDTAITTCIPKGFQLVGDYMYATYTEDGTYVSKKTINSATYTSASGTYETPIIGNPRQTKKLLSIGVNTEYLPADGQIILNYKKDEETSWTTIFTNTTNDSIYYDAINIESSGATLPQYREIQFQILSTGNAVITGLYIIEEIISKEKYG